MNCVVCTSGDNDYIYVSDTGEESLGGNVKVITSDSDRSKIEDILNNNYGSIRKAVWKELKNNWNDTASGSMRYKETEGGKWGDYSPFGRLKKITYSEEQEIPPASGIMEAMDDIFSLYYDFSENEKYLDMQEAESYISSMEEAIKSYKSHKSKGEYGESEYDLTLIADELINEFNRYVRNDNWMSMDYGDKYIQKCDEISDLYESSRSEI